MTTQNKWVATLFLLILIPLLAACTGAGSAPTLEPTEIPPAATSQPSGDADDVGLANPASVYCEEQGGTLENRTTDEGEIGICVFADDSECEEWAFYRGECAPGEGGGAGASGEALPESINVVRALQLREASSLEILENQPGDQSAQSLARFADPAQFAALLDTLDAEILLTGGADCEDRYLLRFSISAEMSHDLGYLCLAPGGPAQIRGMWGEQVIAAPLAFQTEFDALLAASATAGESGGGVEDAPLASAVDEMQAYGWYGRIESLPEGAQFDDRLVLWQEDLPPVGIIGSDGYTSNMIADLRDSERLAHFWGLLVCGVPDVNGCQLNVTRVRPDSPGDISEPDPVAGWQGTLDRIGGEPHSGGDLYLQLTGEWPLRYGVSVTDNEALSAEVDSLVGTGRSVRVWGDLRCGIPDVGGCQIVVERLETVE